MNKNSKSKNTKLCFVLNFCTREYMAQDHDTLIDSMVLPWCLMGQVVLSYFLVLFSLGSSKQLKTKPVWHSFLWVGDAEMCLLLKLLDVGSNLSYLCLINVIGLLHFVFLSRWHLHERHWILNCVFMGFLIALEETI